LLSHFGIKSILKINVIGLISDEAYAVGWDGDAEHGASKNSLHDKLSEIDASITAIIGIINSFYIGTAGGIVGEGDLIPGLLIEDTRTLGETTRNNWTKAWTMKLGLPLGSCLIKWEQVSDVGGSMQGRIYVDDVAIGTAQTTSGNSWEEKQQVVTNNVSIGGEISLYVKSVSPGDLINARNFQMYADFIQIERHDI
jgi:hypothetical protein